MLDAQSSNLNTEQQVMSAAASAALKLTQEQMVEMVKAAWSSACKLHKCRVYRVPGLPNWFYVRWRDGEIYRRDTYIVTDRGLEGSSSVTLENTEFRYDPYDKWQVYK